MEDFLFDYYSFRPALLRRWHPGPGAVLGGAAAADYLRRPDYRAVDGGVTLDLGAVLDRRGETVRFVRRLLGATASRQPHLGCLGMHEWAMVYRAGEIRHAGWPLRLDADRIAAVVEERGLRCSHFDAFRFFTEAARPRNALQPRRETQVALEQGGCLHANMDVYRWAYKLSPLTPSELIADCFELAGEIRVLDMRASPYDFAALGYSAVRMETAEGRAEYVGAQRDFAQRAAVLRNRLLDLCAAVSL